RAGARVRDVLRPRGDDGPVHPAAAARATVGQVTARRRIAPSAAVWIALGILYFFLPLFATLLYSMRKISTGKCCTAASYGFIFHQGDFWHTIKISFLLALETIVISLILFVPSIYLVHLKLPKLRPVLAFMALIPFVVPPIVLVVGLLNVFRGAPG